MAHVNEHLQTLGLWHQSFQLSRIACCPGLLRFCLRRLCLVSCTHKTDLLAWRFMGATTYGWPYNPKCGYSPLHPPNQRVCVTPITSRATRRSIDSSQDLRPFGTLALIGCVAGTDALPGNLARLEHLRPFLGSIMACCAVQAACWGVGTAPRHDRIH